jgi:uncharacterized protein
MFWTSLIIIFGLVVFEIVNSVDNAIVNAHVLKDMSKKWRKIFLFWGILIAVFVVRGLLPLVVVWSSVPEIGFMGALHAMFSQDAGVRDLMEARRGIILMAAGVFLLLLYLHWLFLEEKHPLFVVDKFIKPQYGIWFFACAAIILLTLLYFSKHSPLLMISSACGNALFFIMYGFREQAAKQEKRLMRGSSHMSDFSKLLYLEVLDASFSFDGVMGAFAFTTSVPLILIGNGLGALIVRDLTIRSIEKVGHYIFLKNGAMTSIGLLGAVIIAEGFGLNIPKFIPTLITFLLVGIAFWQSKKFLKKNAH